MKARKTEKLLFKVDGVVLRYTAHDVSIIDGFVIFTDKFGESFSYRKDLLLARLPVRGGSQ